MVTYETKRLAKGLALWRAEAVSPNGHPGQYYVTSQSGNGRYLSATAWAKCGRRCTCKDYQVNKRTCKHIIAAEMAEAADRIARKIEGGVDLERIRSELLRMACAGMSGIALMKWEPLWIVANELAGEPIV